MVLFSSIQEIRAMIIATAEQAYMNGYILGDILDIQNVRSDVRIAVMMMNLCIGLFEIVPRVFRGTENKTKYLASRYCEQNRKSDGHRREVYVSVASHPLESRLLSVASRDDVDKCCFWLCHNYEISTQNDFNFHLTSSTEEA